MPLPKPAREFLTDFTQDEVIAGFKSPDEIIAAAAEILAEDDCDPDEVAAFAKPLIARAVAAQLQAQAAWPLVTDCDRLIAAFQDLERAGIVARHHWHFDSDAGINEMLELIESLREQGHSPRGYTFYHQQDTQLAVNGRGLCLDYGTADNEGDEDDSVAIGHEVVKHLRAHALKVDWSGEIEDRICINMKWQHRWKHGN